MLNSNPISAELVKKKSNLFLDIFFLFVLSLVIWGSVATFNFVWDDTPFIVNNKSIRSFSNILLFFTDKTSMATDSLAGDIPLFRPLRNISFLLDYQLVGLKPTWWHIHNALLHFCNSVLVLLIARSLFTVRYASLLSAGIFLVHPVQTEVVAWVKCRDDLLSTFFTLLLFMFWIRWKKSGEKKGIWNLVCLAVLYALACLAKEQAVIIPLLLFVYEFLVPVYNSTKHVSNLHFWSQFKNQLLNRSSLKTYFIFGMTGLFFLIWRTCVLKGVAQSNYPGGDFYHTMLTMPSVLGEYSRLLIYPLHQSADYSDLQVVGSWKDIKFWSWITALIIILISLFVFRKKYVHEVAGVSWILLSLLPVLNFVPMMQFMAERFLYLPLVGFSFFCGSMLSRIEIKNRQTSFAMLILVLFSLAIGTLNRLPIWKNEFKLYEATAKDTHFQAVRPYYNFVSSMEDSGRFYQALPHAKRLWSQNADNPKLSLRQKADISRILGISYLNLGQFDSSFTMLEKSVNLDPGNVINIQNLNSAHLKKTFLDSALHVFEQGSLESPRDPRCDYKRGLALQAMNHFHEAMDAFLKSLSKDSTYSPAKNAIENLNKLIQESSISF